MAICRARDAINESFEPMLTTELSIDKVNEIGRYEPHRLTVVRTNEYGETSVYTGDDIISEATEMLEEYEYDMPEPKSVYEAILIMAEPNPGYPLLCVNVLLSQDGAIKILRIQE